MHSHWVIFMMLFIWSLRMDTEWSSLRDRCDQLKQRQ